MPMDDKITKTLRLKQETWDAIQAEATTFRRSVNAQIELILEERYGLKPKAEEPSVANAIDQIIRRLSAIENAVGLTQGEEVEVLLETQHTQARKIK